MTMQLPYSLYLVTDSTQSILGKRSLVDVYRDKTSETADLIETAKQLHAVTQKHGVPLLINDRIDVALAVGAEGVHIGQDDIDLPSARRLLGDDAIIGVTASTIEEAQAAADGGANYLGIGTVFATPTKENTKSIIGTAGVQEILNSLETANKSTRTYCIGGINESNAQRVLYQSTSDKRSLDGVAVVSAIMAAQDPLVAAKRLRELIQEPPPFASSTLSRSLSTSDIVDQAPAIVKRLGEQNPLCHNMTNLVVQNFAANVALAIGASPIMSNNGDEAGDLAKLGGALVINMGTSTPEGFVNYCKSLRAYNAVGGPTLFDPVGAGATAQRREGVKRMLANGYFNVIKGNEGEIKTVAGSGSSQQRGVDSGTSTLDEREKAQLVKKLAARERNVVLMTGRTDYISDGTRTFAISNGHEYLGSITGSGCTLGTTIAAYLAVHRQDFLLAALTGILMYEIAAERAAMREDVKGPGTFVPAFIDTLFNIRKAASAGDNSWISAAKVEQV
ncbi:MAG: hypothetical protein M1821_001668 [Bathelium mastoideum]|nr:MAG: hypothetical protein M1821_001668 [Bathelium mastoideum]